MYEQVQPLLSMMLQYSLSQRFQGAMLGATIASPDHLIPCQTLTDWICDRHSYPSISVANPALTALQLTPLWLYSHESWRQRKGWLEQLSPQTTDLPTLWLFGEAIAQALRPQFQPAICIPTLLDRWFSHSRSGAPPIPEVWQQDLNQLHQSLQQQQSLSNIASALEQIPSDRRSLLLALFCFLDTPYDTTISLYRAAQLDDPITLGLTGILLGACNGWQSFGINTLWSVNNTTRAQIQNIATKLLRSWSGQLASDKGLNLKVLDLTEPPIVLASK